MEEGLISRTIAGDPKAAEALYERHAQRVYAIVRRLAEDDDQAEDWAQEAWLRIFRALPTFRGDARFSTWAHRIAVNTALHGRRSSRRRLRRVIEMAEPPQRAVTPDRPLLRLGLDRAVAALPKRMRVVLVLHDVEGYTHEEIGRMLGVSPGTCKSQLFKARAKLREMLSPARPRLEGEEVCST